MTYINDCNLYVFYTKNKNFLKIIVFWIKLKNKIELDKIIFLWFGKLKLMKYQLIKFYYKFKKFKIKMIYKTENKKLLKTKKLWSKITN